MSGRSAFDVDPVTHPPFSIGRSERVATAGSCFAQHISRALTELGFTHLVTEPPVSGSAADEAAFSARFGNVYTARQLLQLFRRAYGVLEPDDVVWRRPDGRWLDAFRPRIPAEGFATPDALLDDQQRHLAAVREIFETCDVFVFTLGLTEAWVAKSDGLVVPLAPGVVGAPVGAAEYTFHNFTVAEVEADLLAFIDLLATVNAAARVILTVSPISLAATFEDRHVLVSTTYSKSVLRVAAEAVSRARANVAYFPAYEIITGPHGRGAFHEDNLRDVRPAATAHVMAIFARHYLTEEAADRTRKPPPPGPSAHGAELERIREAAEADCDEEALDPNFALK